ncbi:unnamed protein product, partial [Allacma fusca]
IFRLEPVTLYNTKRELTMPRRRVTPRKSYGGMPPRKFLAIPTMKDTITKAVREEVQVFVRAS